MYTNKKPLVSIVMPVYNYGLYIEEAIGSILTQSMPDFEFIIINDGSTDNSSEIVHSYNDPRIRVIDFTNNKGCYPARNFGMRRAMGEYICVMDADDISLPNRLERQCVYFKENSDIGLIGSAFRFMDDFHSIYKNTCPEIIKLLQLRYCYLLHPTCMIRNSLVKKYNLYYDESYIYASDYAWQVKASSLFPVSNINEVLLLYRQHENQISSKNAYQQGDFAHKVRFLQLISIGLKIESYGWNIILDFIFRSIIKEENIPIVLKFVDDFIVANRVKCYYSQEKLPVMLNVWMDECVVNNKL